MKYEFNVDKNKISFLNEYLEIIRPYPKSRIDSLKESGKWKALLSAKTLFKSSKNIDENLCKCLWGKYKEIMIGIETHEIINKLFKSLFTGYQEVLENKRKSNDFVFDYVDRLSCLYHKISLNCGGPYRDPHDWIKNIKATIFGINTKFEEKAHVNSMIVMFKMIH